MKLLDLLGYRPNGDKGWVMDVAGRRVPVELKPSPRARRITLRADAAQGVIRISLHPRTSSARALEMLETHHEWIAVRVAAWPVPSRFEPGAIVPIEGEEVVIDWSPQRPRSAIIESGRLRIGGPPDGLAGRVERALRAHAKTVLTAETREMTAKIGKPIAAVTVRDTTSRWGSCTSTGCIAYSWRLILAPREVRRYVVAHEVAHLVHMNHSPAFWGVAEALYGGDIGRPRRWLKRHGPGLHWIGRG